MPTKNTCRFAVTAKGKYNRKHQCRSSCDWNGEQALAWCDRTPYPGQSEPAMRIELTPCPCGRPTFDHFTTKVARNGSVGGVTLTCADFPRHTFTKRHLLSCDCLECVTSRITRDRAAA